MLNFGNSSSEIELEKFESLYYLAEEENSTTSSLFSFGTFETGNSTENSSWSWSKLHITVQIIIPFSLTILLLVILFLLYVIYYAKQTNILEKRRNTLRQEEEEAVIEAQRKSYVRRTGGGMGRNSTHSIEFYVTPSEAEDYETPEIPGIQIDDGYEYDNDNDSVFDHNDNPI